MLQIESFEFSPIYENTYIVYNEFNECIIVDPGCYYDHEKETLESYINEKKLKPVHLLNTHCHLDHVFGNAFVAEKYNLELQIHPLEKAVLDFAPTSGLMYDLPFTNYLGKINHLTPGEVIHLGNDSLQILFTPGHSPGSVSFYSKEYGFVLGGDVLFKGSIGRTDLPGGNMETLLDSVRKQLFVLPDATVVYSGHGSPTDIGTEKSSNPFF
jgi:glyoxylase-like metal-dependent hydrolase (beta-lactamase superfamily II)